jgi:hypothetical protein
MTTAAEILNKAAAHMNGRAATYDQPEGERSMAQTVAVFNLHHGTSLTEAQGWHFMQILKDVRLFSKGDYHADSAEDCVSYAALKAEAKAKQQPKPGALLAEDIYRAFAIPKHLIDEIKGVKASATPAQAARAEELQADEQAMPTKTGRDLYYEQMKACGWKHHAPWCDLSDDDQADWNGQAQISHTGDGWIEWEGGVCPVREDTPVEVRYANGSIKSVRPADHYEWEHECDDFNVVAYRIAKDAA